MDIVEKGYKIFQDYHISKIENACTVCCLNEDEVNQLVNLNVRDIPVELLSTYNDSAQAYDPEIREFKHFLPRYLDLIYQFDFPSHSVELALRNISIYNSTNWSIEEWNHLNEFMVEVFNKCVKTYPIPNNFGGLSPILIMLNKAGFAIPPFLELWEKDDGIISCLHYKTLMTEDFNWMKKTKISNPFSNEEQSKILYNWFNKEIISEVSKNRNQSLIF